MYYEFERKVYEAINLYKFYYNHPKLKENAFVVYEEYKNGGGKHTFEYFEDTLDDYLVQGDCGY